MNTIWKKIHHFYKKIRYFSFPKIRLIKNSNFSSTETLVFVKKIFSGKFHSFQYCIHFSGYLKCFNKNEEGGNANFSHPHFSIIHNLVTVLKFVYVCVCVHKVSMKSFSSNTSLHNFKWAKCGWRRHLLLMSKRFTYTLRSRREKLE